MDEFISLTYKGFQLSYHADNLVVDAQKLLQELESMQMRLKNCLNIATDDLEIEIEVYTDRGQWIDHHTFLYGPDMPSWIQADSGRIIRINMDEKKAGTFDNLVLIAEHETVHHVIREYTRFNIPGWLDEGLALYLTQDLPDHYLEALQAGLKNDATLCFELLETSFAAFDRKVKTLAYAQSCSMVGFIVEHYGWILIRQMLDALKRREDMNHVLNQSGTNLYLLEKEWKMSCHDI